MGDLTLGGPNWAKSLINTDERSIALKYPCGNIFAIIFRLPGEATLAKAPPLQVEEARPINERSLYRVVTLTLYGTSPKCTLS